MYLEGDIAHTLNAAAVMAPNMAMPGRPSSEGEANADRRTSKCGGEKAGTGQGARRGPADRAGRAGQDHARGPARRYDLCRRDDQPHAAGAAASAWTEPQQYFYVQGGLGQGIGIALGMKIAARTAGGAARRRRHVPVQSGGAGPRRVEADNKLPILIVIFNNRKYLSMKQGPPPRTIRTALRPPRTCTTA